MARRNRFRSRELIADCSLDQFRGYTVLGRCLDKFIGGFRRGLFRVQRNDNFFSYADSIMPSFHLSLGMRCSADDKHLTICVTDSLAGLSAVAALHRHPSFRRRRFQDLGADCSVLPPGWPSLERRLSTCFIKRGDRLLASAGS